MREIIAGILMMHIELDLHMVQMAGRYVLFLFAVFAVPLHSSTNEVIII